MSIEVSFIDSETLIQKRWETRGAAAKDIVIAILAIAYDSKGNNIFETIEPNQRNEYFDIQYKENVEPLMEQAVFEGYFKSIEEVKKDELVAIALLDVATAKLCLEI